MLKDDEVLILFLIRPGQHMSLVFALSKTDMAWAVVGMSGQELERRLAVLRGEIDPVSRETVPDGSAAAQTSKAYDRQAAFEVYKALLGDAAVQAVINGKPELLIVPSGPLTSFPLGALVTAPPAPGPLGASAATVLRGTPWLLRTHAIAVLPSVSTLRTLRQILPEGRPPAPDPLLAFVDPDLRRPKTPPAAATAAVPEKVSARSLETVLRELPTLPGTLEEGDQLSKALGGGRDSVLSGVHASKSELMARDADLRLQKVRVLEFATHGLQARVASDLAEPALVLAAGPKPADSVLLASEAAGLRLNADWVLLSACDTAGPDGLSGQGLSGLARAFFYAGARTVLVSHWRIDDKVAAKLVPSVLLAEKVDPGINRARALQRASLAILDDPGLNAADPAAWAAFSLVGDPDR